MKDFIIALSPLMLLLKIVGKYIIFCTVFSKTYGCVLHGLSLDPIYLGDCLVLRSLYMRNYIYVSKQIQCRSSVMLNTFNNVTPGISSLIYCIRRPSASQEPYLQSPRVQVARNLAKCIQNVVFAVEIMIRHFDEGNAP